MARVPAIDSINDAVSCAGVSYVLKVGHNIAMAENQWIEGHGLVLDEVMMRLARISIILSILSVLRHELAEGGAHLTMLASHKFREFVSKD